jgi:hypothetical protein
VVFLVLVAILFLHDLCVGLEKAEFAFGDFVYLHLDWEYWRRLYFGVFHQERMAGVQGAEVFDVLFCALRGADYWGSLGDGYLAGGIFDQHCCFGTPGMVGEYIYDCF